MLLEVYGPRWVSRSSKPLQGVPRRPGWVRLPYASAQIEAGRLFQSAVERTAASSGLRRVCRDDLRPNLAEDGGERGAFFEAADGDPHPTIERSRTRPPREHAAFRQRIYDR